MSPRQVLRLDSAWLFHAGDIDSPVPTDKHIAAYMANKAGWARGAARINYDDSDWRQVDLPHDWSVEGPIDKSNYLDNGFLPRGVGWYRRHFQLDESDRGRYLALRFDGFGDVVIWNPGESGAAALPDMEADEHRRMVCVEAARIGRPVALAPGERWEGGQRLGVADTR